MPILLEAILLEGHKIILRGDGAALSRLGAKGRRGVGEIPIKTIWVLRR